VVVMSFSDKLNNPTPEPAGPEKCEAFFPSGMQCLKQPARHHKQAGVPLCTGKDGHYDFASRNFRAITRGIPGAPEPTEPRRWFGRPSRPRPPEPA
jgi:hypothetical protein